MDVSLFQQPFGVCVVAILHLVFKLDNFMYVYKFARKPPLYIHPWPFSGTVGLVLGVGQFLFSVAVGGCHWPTGACMQW